MMTKEKKEIKKELKVYWVHGIRIEAETIEESIEKYNLLNKK